MFSVAKQPMKKCMNKLKTILTKNKEIRQWMWFVALWFVGLIAVVILTYPFKMLIKLAS